MNYVWKENPASPRGLEWGKKVDLARSSLDLVPLRSIHDMTKSTRRWVSRKAAGLEAFLYLSGSFTKHSVDEGHNSRLQADFIFVASRRSVQVRQERLKQITWYNLWICILELYGLLKQAANNNCWMLTFHEEGNLMDLCNTYEWNFLSNVDVLIYVCFYGIFNCSSNDFSSKLENILRP